nr:carbohydrate ABC transporter permease [Leifsonia psychrotolerans]
MYLIVINAAKTQDQYGTTNVWSPAGLSGLVGNITEAWTRGNISEAVWSSTLYAITAPLIAVVIGAAAGFAIVVLRLRHGFGWFVFIFSSTVFPLQILLLPLFVGYVAFDLYDSRLGMILVYTAISIPFSAFVMRNFFAGIALSVFEAAVVDGASSWRIFWRIHLPLSVPALVAVFILQATLIWNDLLLGMTLSKSADIRPLMGSLAALQGNYGGSTAPVLLAGGLIVSIPTIALFLFAQRAFGRGLALGQY